MKVSSDRCPLGLLVAGVLHLEDRLERCLEVGHLQLKPAGQLGGGKQRPVAVLVPALLGQLDELEFDEAAMGVDQVHLQPHIAHISLARP